MFQPQSVVAHTVLSLQYTVNLESSHKYYLNWISDTYGAFYSSNCQISLKYHCLKWILYQMEVLAKIHLIWFRFDLVDLVQVIRFLFAFVTNADFHLFAFYLSKFALKLPDSLSFIIHKSRPAGVLTWVFMTFAYHYP